MEKYFIVLRSAQIGAPDFTELVETAKAWLLPVLSIILIISGIISIFYFVKLGIQLLKGPEAEERKMIFIKLTFAIIGLIIAIGAGAFIGIFFPIINEAAGNPIIS